MVGLEPIQPQLGVRNLAGEIEARNQIPLPFSRMFRFCSQMERAYQGDETTGFQSPAQDYVEQAV
ncbi:MAG: hypothetical protein ACYDD1_19935, partial [Caulobacteraceae bacterium]